MHKMAYKNLCCEAKIWHIQSQKIEIHVLRPKFSEKPRSEADKKIMSACPGMTQGDPQDDPGSPQGDPG